MAQGDHAATSSTTAVRELLPMIGIIFAFPIQFALAWAVFMMAQVPCCSQSLHTTLVTAHCVRHYPRHCSLPTTLVTALVTAHYLHHRALPTSLIIAHYSSHFSLPLSLPTVSMCYTHVRTLCAGVPRVLSHFASSERPSGELACAGGN